MNIAAFDLSETATGVATLREGIRCCGVHSFALLPSESERPGLRWARVREWFRSHLTKPEKVAAMTTGGMSYERTDRVPAYQLVAWEKVVGGSLGGDARSALYILQASLLEVANDLGIETATVAPSSLKKFATGSGRAKKPEMLAAAKARFPGVYIADHNAADALHVLDWAYRAFRGRA